METLLTSRQFLHAFDRGGGQLGDVQMSDARRSADPLAGRPHINSTQPNPSAAANAKTFFQTLIAQNRADKSKLHGWNLSC